MQQQFPMLVKALCLRYLGHKLSADELRGELPMIGNLRFEDSPLGPRTGRGALTCLLMPLTGSTEPKVQLFHARVRRIDARGLIIQGTEDVWRRKARDSYRQALWCWPIDAEEVKPAPADPVDAEDEAAAQDDALRGR